MHRSSGGSERRKTFMKLTQPLASQMQKLRSTGGPACPGLPIGPPATRPQDAPQLAARSQGGLACWHLQPPSLMGGGSPPVPLVWLPLLCSVTYSKSLVAGPCPPFSHYIFLKGWKGFFFFLMSLYLILYFCVYTLPIVGRHEHRLPSKLLPLMPEGPRKPPRGALTGCGQLCGWIFLAALGRRSQEFQLPCHQGLDPSPPRQRCFLFLSRQFRVQREAECAR